MTLPIYEEYRQSDADWIGSVPSHWAVEPIKKSGFSVVGGSTPKSDEATYWDGDIVWVSPADLSRLHSMYIGDSGRKITEAGLHSCGTTLVPPDSIILSTRAPIGSLAIAATMLCTNQGCKSLVPTGKASSHYFAYVLLSATTPLNLRGKGTTFLELSADELASFRVPSPPLREQAAIATFLDRETAKIDALIAEQEKLIALLAEKRQATISNAVTRGLDPNAPMKDSGVAWLGDVPAHWSIRPLKHIARLVTGTTPPTDDESNYSGEGNPWIRPEDLDETGAASLATKFLSPKGLAVSRVIQPGAVLVCCIGTIGKIGQTEIAASTNQQITSAEFFGHRRYFFYVTVAARSEFEQSATGNVLKILNSERLGRVSYPIPGREEQIKIAEYLDGETSRIDALTERANQAIVLLGERRAALITAAITGQIKVFAD